MFSFATRKRSVNEAINSRKDEDETIFNENNAKNKRVLSSQNKNIVLNYVAVERNKESSSEVIASEYSEKVILYGYLIVSIFDLHL